MSQRTETPAVKVRRLIDAPIISAATDASLGENIQGPSLVRVPEWVESPLGRYYLYFADHKGEYIRLAYADALSGPWTVHVPGSLQLEDSHFPIEPPEVPPGALERLREAARDQGFDLDTLPHDPILELTAPHIASPDVIVDRENRRFIMYFHGLESFAEQDSRVATSEDGLNFKAHREIIGAELGPGMGKTYLRVFRYRGFSYAMAMPGQFYRSADGISNWAVGPRLFESDMRHSGLLLREDRLWVFWTRVGDAPERILLSTIDLEPDWMDWRDGRPIEVLRPEREWEGASSVVEPSARSVAYGRVNQLRDPAIYVEGESTYLLYAVAGESGIGIAQIDLENT